MRANRIKPSLWASTKTGVSVFSSFFYINKIQIPLYLTDSKYNAEKFTVYVGYGIIWATEITIQI